MAKAEKTKTRRVKKSSSVDSGRLKSIDDLKPAPYNPRRIGDDAANGLGYSLAEFGDISGIVWNAQTGHLVAGHQRVEQLRKRGAQLVRGELRLKDGHRFPVRVVDWPLAKEQAANVTANNPAIGGEFTPDLDALLAEVKSSIGPEAFEELNLDELVGTVGGAGKPSDTEARATLAESFGVPPFSVLDARQGYWQERKRAWLALGIQSEIGRGGAPGGSPRPAARLTDSGHTVRGDGRGRQI